MDFAYAIHSDVGERCVGAKVNGKIVPLRYKLKNGDTVEVLTSPGAHPSKDWLTFVKTSRAQQRIRGFIKQQQREKSLQLGRELAGREFKRFGLNLNKLLKGGELKPVAAELGYRIEDDLLVAVGYGKVAPNQLLARLLPPEKLAETEKERSAKAEPANGPARRPARSSTAHGFGRVTELAKKLVGRRSRTGVLIGGVDDVLVRFGRCCNPVPGRPHRRLHHPRPGRDGAHRRLRARRWPPTPSGGWTSPGTCAATSSGRSRCGCSPPIGPGLLADMSQHLQQEGRQHLPGELPGDRRRPGGEHLRGHHLGPEAAHRPDADHRAAEGRVLGGARLTAQAASAFGLAGPGESSACRDCSSARTSAGSAMNAMRAAAMRCRSCPCGFRQISSSRSR